MYWQQSFALGSKLIVTTRNKDVLNLPQVGGIYEVNKIHPDQALLLFCKYTFRNEAPTAEDTSLSHDIVVTTGDLPLALEAIGSFLAVKTRRIHEDTLKQLKRILDKEVLEEKR